MRSWIELKYTPQRLPHKSHAPHTPRTPLRSKTLPLIRPSAIFLQSIVTPSFRKVCTPTWFVLSHGCGHAIERSGLDYCRGIILPTRVRPFHLFQRPRAWAAASGGRVRCVPRQRPGQPLFPQGAPLSVQRCVSNDCTWMCCIIDCPPPPLLHLNIAPV